MTMSGHVSTHADWFDAVRRRAEQEAALGTPDAHTGWVRFLRTLNTHEFPWEDYEKLSSVFAASFGASTKERTQLWLPTSRSVGAVVTVMNEEGALRHVISELNRLALKELIFVVNGSTDRSYEMIRHHSRAVIQHYDEPVGHDVGRALGAKTARAEAILFLDGDFVISAEQLLPMIHAIERGMDVVLNDINGFVDVFAKQDNVTRVKVYLNRLLGRPDLGCNSLTAVPHALTRRAIEVIGVRHLMVPPLAHVIAIRKGLTVGCAGSVDVFRKNRLRQSNVGKDNPVASLILGDHAEAIAAVLSEIGHRGPYPDAVRDRNMVKGSDGHVRHQHRRKRE